MKLITRLAWLGFPCDLLNPKDIGAYNIKHKILSQEWKSVSFLREMPGRCYDGENTIFHLLN